MASNPKPPAKAELKDAPPVDFAAHQDNTLHALVNRQAAKDVLLLLVSFRFINALFVRTFFQPDEYFQSLEPAWQMAFGAESGAWITWASPPLP
jgi:phosphatidylinositol glycan class B